MGLSAEGGRDLRGPSADRAPRDEGDGGACPLPTVSVVVATRGRRQRLLPFLEAVTADPATSEVVVVLDGDVDGSYPLLEQLQESFPTMRPILVDSEGQMVALGRGVEAATGDVVLLMDDDVLSDPGLVTGHARSHADATGLVVLGYMPVQLDPTSSSATRLYASWYESHCARLESGELTVLDGLWLGNVSARRADLLRVGVSSDSFPVRWHADTDLGLRMHAGGLRGVFDRQLRATHRHAKSAEAFLEDNRERGAAHGSSGAHTPSALEWRSRFRCSKGCPLRRARWCRSWPERAGRSGAGEC